MTCCGASQAAATGVKREMAMLRLRRRARVRTARAHRYLRATVGSRVKQVLLFIAGLLFRVKVKVKGTVALPLRQGFIVAANHLNGADSFVLLIGLKTRLFFVTSAKWFVGRISRFFMTHVAESLPVQTGDPVGSVVGLRRCIHTLEEGGSVGIFPEGDFNLSGRVETLNPGAAYLSARTGKPVLPVIVQNLRLDTKVDQSNINRECWTGFRSVAENLLNPDIELLVGDPVLPDPEPPDGPDDLRREVSRINQELRQRFDELAAVGH